MEPDCHPERSEGTRDRARETLDRGILRFAQDDRFDHRGVNVTVRFRYVSTFSPRSVPGLNFHCRTALMTATLNGSSAPATICGSRTLPSRPMMQRTTTVAGILRINIDCGYAGSTRVMTTGLFTSPCTS